MYNTGVPALKLTHALHGKAPALKLPATIAQSEVSDDFSVPVPVEIQFAHAKSLVHWVRTSGDPVQFSIPLRQVPLKVVLDPQGSVLRR